MYKIIERRTYDLSACTNSNVSVHWNKNKIETQSFQKYIDLYIGNREESSRIYQRINDRWEICVAFHNDDQFRQVSFVNGINTTRGASMLNILLNNYVQN